MNRTAFIRWIAYYVWLLICITAYPQTITLPDKVASNTDVTVSNDLRNILLNLYCTISSSGVYPETLSAMVKYDTDVKQRTKRSVVLNLDPNDFVCPGTGTRPGAMTNVDEWTDYIYIGGVSEAVPSIALVISPPEHHHGEYGYVATADRGILRLPPGEVRALIKEPWLLATNASPADIESVKRYIKINIPARLRPYYTNANTSADLGR